MRMFWGMLLTSKVADNFLGVGVCMFVICIFHDKSGDEMHFWVLNNGRHSKISATRTDLAPYMSCDGPEQFIKNECVWCVTQTTSKEILPRLF